MNKQEKGMEEALKNSSPDSNLEDVKKINLQFAEKIAKVPEFNNNRSYYNVDSIVSRLMRNENFKTLSESEKALIIYRDIRGAELSDEERSNYATAINSIYKHSIEEQENEKYEWQKFSEII